MKRIDLLKCYFTSAVIEKYITNTCRNHGFLPISEECHEYFHQKVSCIHDAHQFLMGSFIWDPNDTIDWYDVIGRGMVNINLPMVEKIKPHQTMERFKFV